MKKKLLVLFFCFERSIKIQGLEGTLKEGRDKFDSRRGRYFRDLVEVSLCKVLCKLNEREVKTRFLIAMEG